MPRKKRMYIAGMPTHVVQRGNDRQACFYTESDYRFYLECLQEACENYKVSVHAYVLMTNHVHLLMTPEVPEVISKVMQSVGRRFVQMINHTYKRTGTLWEGRHKASLVNADEYLLVCHRYIEMNPVRANMVQHPGDYQWSSYLHNGQGKNNSMLTEHEVYKAFGQEQEIRTARYRDLFKTVLDIETLSSIRMASQFAMPLGNAYFKAQIEEMLRRSVAYSKEGPPTPMRVEEWAAAYDV